MLSLLGTLGGVALKWLLDLFVPSKDRILGRTEAELDARKRHDETEKKIAGVEPSSESDTVERLRDGEF